MGQSYQWHLLHFLLTALVCSFHKNHRSEADAVCGNFCSGLNGIGSFLWSCSLILTTFVFIVAHLSFKSICQDPLATKYTDQLYLSIWWVCFIVSWHVFAAVLELHCTWQEKLMGSVLLGCIFLCAPLEPYGALQSRASEACCSGKQLCQSFPRWATGSAAVDYIQYREFMKVRNSTLIYAVQI